MGWKLKRGWRNQMPFLLGPFLNRPENFRLGSRSVEPIQAQKTAFLAENF
jgi:hypothetical protein